MKNNMKEQIFWSDYNMCRVQPKINVMAEEGFRVVQMSVHSWGNTQWIHLLFEKSE